MKTARIIYIIVWAIPIALAALYLAGAIKTTTLQADATTEYVLSLLSVTLTLAVAYLGLRLFRFKSVRRYLNLDDEAQSDGKDKNRAEKVNQSAEKDNQSAAKNKHCGLRSFQGLCIVREVAILAVCLLDLATYYILQTESALYLAGIILISLMFCYPNNN